MNKVNLIGRTTDDINIRYTDSGTAVASFTLAVNRNFKNKDGEVEAEFINIVAWRRLAETIAKYVKKGNQLGVSGRLQVRNYEAKDGTKRYITEVIAEDITFIGSRRDDNPNQSTNKEDTNFGVPVDDFHQIDDDDLPF